MPRTLSRDEARRRAALLDVTSYAVELDLTGLVDGSAFTSTTVVSFGCREPGATTFLELDGELLELVRGGAPVRPDMQGNRIVLADLAAHEVVRVVARCTTTRTGEGLHRSVDPADGQVYLYAQAFLDDAQRIFACFDQPDLKARVQLTVTAPAAWTVLANTRAVRDGSRHVFAPTEPIATYLVTLAAGPWHGEQRWYGGIELGVWCRASLAAHLEADELFTITAACLDVQQDIFGRRYPFGDTYDQVFVPEFNAGAMENPGMVTFSDQDFVFRSRTTQGHRRSRAQVIAHEMAHMWFGDLVTMRWWDDLWLNEAFAEWACHWAAAAATVHTDIWASFLAGRKLGGYTADRAPSSHPIRQAAPDVAAAAAGFDSITYAKGASVLKQLVAWVGEDAFVTGLRAYFARYAWGNATLDDLMAELSKASGRDLAAWTKGWLETAGTDTLTLRGAVLSVQGPAGGPPRPHRLDVGVYVRDGAALIRRDVLSLETAGSEVTLDVTAPVDLLLINDDDLTFAAVRPDPASVRALLAAAPALPTVVARTLAVTTAWQLVVLGELSAREFVACATAVLDVERNDALVEPVLTLAVNAADLWSPEHDREALLDAVAETCVQLAAQPATRLVATRSLARTASSDAQLGALEELAGHDVDLAWRRLQRLASLERLPAGAVEALEAADPDPDAAARAVVVRAARPTDDAKREAWAAARGTRVPLSGMRALREAFWQSSQADLLAPYAERYLTALPEFGGHGMIPTMVLAGTLFPMFGVDAGYVDRLERVAAGSDVDPVARQIVVERSDELRRMLAARG